MMKADLLYLLVISSGSVFASAVLKKNFAETIAISQMAIMLILFLFGLAGAMYLGVLAVIGLTAVAYLLAFWQIFKKNIWKSFMKGIVITGGLFLLAFLLFRGFDYGRMCYHWDDFNHWMNVVKIMTIHDDFGTHPGAYAPFGSYPPGISLLQYLFQKINFLVYSGAEFSEWRAYLSYHIFMLSMYFPFLKNVTIRKPVRLILLCAIAVFYRSLSIRRDMNP